MSTWFAFRARRVERRVTALRAQVAATVETAKEKLTFNDAQRLLERVGKAGAAEEEEAAGQTAIPTDGAPAPAESPQAEVAQAPGGSAPAFVRRPSAQEAVVPSKPRTWLDKVVDYCVGDGPNSRYALICEVRTSECTGRGFLSRSF